MTSLDPAEIERVELYLVKCSKCKLTIMVGPDDKVCPVCASSLPKPEKRRLTPTSCARLKSSKV